MGENSECVVLYPLLCAPVWAPVWQHPSPLVQASKGTSPAAAPQEAHRRTGAVTIHETAGFHWLERFKWAVTASSSLSYSVPVQKESQSRAFSITWLHPAAGHTLIRQKNPKCQAPSSLILQSSLSGCASKFWLPSPGARDRDGHVLLGHGLGLWRVSLPVVTYLWGPLLPDSRRKALQHVNDWIWLALLMLFSMKKIPWELGGWLSG